MFTPDESFKVIKYTFFRQRQVQDIPGIYLVMCRDTVDQGQRGLYVGQATNLRKRYVEHYNERDNEMLRDLIESCAKPEFAWMPVYEQGRLTEIEQSFISQYRDIVINIQYL